MKSIAFRRCAPCPAPSTNCRRPRSAPTGGGEIAVDPQDQNGTKLLERVFLFDLDLDGQLRPERFGTRVHVRFEHRYEPLARQWYRRMRQLFLSRFDV